MEVGLRYGAETDQIINQIILNFSELSPKFYKSLFSSIAQIQGIAVCTSRLYLLSSTALKSLTGILKSFQ